jgi:predicted neuraminidase
MARTSSRFIYEQAPFSSCHASTIEETRPGEFAAAWFGGSAEGRPDVAIWLSLYADGAWSAPVEVAREPNMPMWNPVLFKGPEGRLWLYYKVGPSPREWTGARRSSADGGRTWSAEERLPAGILGPIKNKPLLLDDGAIISGSSVESYQAWACWVERSTDAGRTWTKHGPIEYPGQPFGLIQPAVTRLPGGALRLFMRSRGIARICYSDSNDRGLTWTPAGALQLPNPNSGIDAVTLRDGRLVLIYNHAERGRTPLNLAVSRDGTKWSMFATLESEPGEYSYPAIIQSSSGDLHATYTWKRRRIRHVEIPLAEVPDA